MTDLEELGAGTYSLFSRDTRTGIEIYRDDLVEEELIFELIEIFEIDMNALIKDNSGKYHIINIFNLEQTLIELTGRIYDSFFDNNIDFFDAEHEIREYLKGEEIKVHITSTGKEIVLSGIVDIGEVVYGSLIGAV